MSAAGDNDNAAPVPDAKLEALLTTTWDTGANSMQLMIGRALRDAGLDAALAVVLAVPVPTREDMVALHRKEGPTQQ